MLNYMFLVVRYLLMFSIYNIFKYEVPIWTTQVILIFKRKTDLSLVDNYLSLNIYLINQWVPVKCLII